MMATKEINKLVRKMKSIYDGDPWYGDSIQKKLQNITPEIALERPIPDAHCIAELLAHIISWRELLNKRLQGEDAFSVSQQESFNWTRFDPDPETMWDSLLKALDKNQQQIISQLKQEDDALLNQKVAQRSYNYRYLIKGIMEHDIYHLGQIALLRKHGVK